MDLLRQKIIKEVPEWKHLYLPPDILFTSLSFLIEETEKGVIINGEKEGEWVEEYIENDFHIKSNGCYLNGQREGMWILQKIFSTFWTLPVEGTYSKGSYIKGQKNGKWLKYVNGILYEDITYKDNVQHGTYKWFWNGTIVREQVEYVNGIKHGGEISLYPNGTLLSQVNYDKGERSGTYKEWSYDGSLRYQKTYFKKGEVYTCMAWD